ncbi:MAG TPA: MFS transporter, partial [Candidatus Dormibacteraeota bacterium]|nr:MFS transporter [Candidatus Dormibacteraeota bacterium]
SRALGALRHRNYRLFFAGQIISTVGTWMQSVAMPWLALELTHSGFLVGLVLAAQFTPILIGGQFGGIVADRFHKRNVLLATQIAFTVPPFVLFLLTASGHAQYWMVIVAALAAGIINVFDIPARQAFIVEMVGKQDLTNAIALNSSVFNGSAVIGPSVAGLVIAFVGVPLCFLSNSVSYLAAVAALLLMRDLPRREPTVYQARLFTRLAEGAGYARRTPVVGGLLVTVAFFSLFAMNRSTLLPLFADEVLKVGAQGFGFMLAAMGLGAVCGALTLAFFPEMGANPRRQLWVAAIWSAALLEFAVARIFVISLVTLFVAGYCQISFLATTNSRLQTITPDHLRGRVMALYMQAFAGVSPIGNLQAGLLASLLGAPWSMAIGAIIAAASLVGITVAVPEVFGQPIKASSTAATASAGTSQRSART